MKYYFTSFCRRRWVRYGSATIVISSVVILVLLIIFVILPYGSKNTKNGIINNETTKDNNSYQVSTDVLTTSRSTQMMSTIEDTRTYMSITSPQNQWIIDSHLNFGRVSFSAINMQNEEILICGGLLYPFHGIVSPSCEIYSSRNRKWRTATNMNVDRYSHTLTLFSNNTKILSVGSTDFIDGYTAEIYDIEADRWMFVPNTMNTIRIRHTATLLRNNQILIVGGYSHDMNSMFSSAQLYIPSSNEFITTGSLNIARYGHTAIRLKDELSVLVIGGYASSPIRPEIYRTDFWSHTAGDMINSCTDCAAVLLPDGDVLVAGGIELDNIAMSSVERYNSVSGTFSLVRPMACARVKFTLTLLPSGQVLAVGGKNPTADECLLVSELYNPIADQWTSTRRLNTIRYDHHAFLVNNSVLIVGGLNASHSDYLTACERYDV